MSETSFASSQVLAVIFRSQSLKQVFMKHQEEFSILSNSVQSPEVFSCVNTELCSDLSTENKQFASNLFD